MSEAIRTCKRCGRQYTGWHCTSPGCKLAREKRNASARRRRMARGGSGRKRRFSAGGSLGETIGMMQVSVYADPCPNPHDTEPDSLGNEYASNVEDMRYPNW